MIWKNKFNIFAVFILVLYFYLRVYGGHNTFLMGLNTFVKNFDIFAGALFAALLAFIYSLILKRFEQLEESRGYVMYCFLVLYRQKAVFKIVGDHAASAIIVTQKPGVNYHDVQCGKWSVSKLSIHIDQEGLNKIFLNRKIANTPKALEKLQHLVCAEDTFNQCLVMVEKFNSLIDEMLLRGGEQNNNLKKEIIVTIGDIKSFHSYCTKLNELAIKNLTDLSKEFFKDFEVPGPTDLVPIMGSIDDGEELIIEKEKD